MEQRSQKAYLKLKMVAEEEVMILRQQQVALRNALRTSEIESAELKKTLDKEVHFGFTYMLIVYAV